MTTAHTGRRHRLATQPTNTDAAGYGWSDARLDLPELDLRGCSEMVVVGAHPDDVTVGFGATAAQLAASGVRVQVVVASDGGIGFPDIPLLQRFQLEKARRSELQRATGLLGLPAPICLGLPGGDVAQHEQRLADLLVEILATKPVGTWCAATWRGDGHSDHEAVGNAAASAALSTGAVSMEYPVWMWQWVSPGDGAVPWDRAFTSPVTPAALERKLLAAQSFRGRVPCRALGGDPALSGGLVPPMPAAGELVFR
ncbi:LmbE family N-acetylglucosaminyl deacetylase [Mycolicibacterium iranicum]|uniref:LmbE family N-acetylglucosaminyl deacetylase n=1 Tax=Mycolicibacterium iranicum TaxID=912594 RepID=A0A839PZW1_MYCIR|nr:PIG-L family deacetylase [Mycolicibacterium iranicum]MBB2989520.1 LmbE family N-acetylglucosaminyl deacetylase [Mycolicibacterium iranicum]